MNPIKIELISKSFNDITRLTRLQRLVCKLFKITPEKKYELIIRFTSVNNYLNFGDIVRLRTNGIAFCITYSSDYGLTDSLYTAISMTPLNHIPENIGDEMVLLGSAYREK